MEQRTIQNFKLVDKLGEGGMGEVFLGIDTTLERKVAIKALRPELMSRQDIVERFRSEAIALAKLNHTNIATLYSFIHFENQFYMVMEYVPGETLDHRISQQGALKWTEAANLICQILKGLEHAHKMGIVHRDIKPANIILTTGDIPKLMDFGIARILETTRLTRAGHLVGTLEYISPEQVSGKETDARSDLYSLGAVFYEMLTGKLPFKKNTDFELMRAQIEEDPQAPSRIVSDIPLPLEKIVLRMLHKTPDKRFPSAAVCLTELERILNTRRSKVAEVPLNKKLTFLRAGWKKYPGIFILIITGSIALIIMALVLLDFSPAGNQKVTDLAAPSHLGSGEQDITASPLPANRPGSSESGETTPSPDMPVKKTPAPKSSSPGPRVVPLEKEPVRLAPVKKPNKPIIPPEPTKIISPRPSKPPEKTPSEPVENKEKGWRIRK